MASITKNKPEIPENEISYFKNRDIKSVNRYILINDGIGVITYERRDNRFFKHVFEESDHGVCEKVETLYDKLPPEVQEIFNAGTKEGIIALRAQGKLKGYIDEKVA